MIWKSFSEWVYMCFGCPCYSWTYMVTPLLWPGQMCHEFKDSSLYKCLVAFVRCVSVSDRKSAVWAKMSCLMSLKCLWMDLIFNVNDLICWLFELCHRWGWRFMAFCFIFSLAAKERGNVEILSGLKLISCSWTSDWILLRMTYAWPVVKIDLKSATNFSGYGIVWPWILCAVKKLFNY